jgi:hypothetical protein
MIVMQMRLFLARVITKKINGPSNSSVILGDLLNRSPISECHCSKIFYLKEEDEKLKDIKEAKVSDVGLSISHNINVLTQTIEEYSNKILTLKKLQENLELLTSI